MSGGVDSSATAALLQEQGYDVIGITLKLWPQDCVSRAEDKCCGPQAVTDARAVCAKLGIPYYLIDEAAEFQGKVIQYFADEYKAGRTPNPCVHVQPEPQVRPPHQPRGPARGSVRGDRPLCPVGAQPGRRPHAAQARPRPAQGPELFPVLAAAGSTGARHVPARREDQGRYSRGRPALPAQDRRQGGEHGDLLRAGQRLRQLPAAGARSSASTGGRS